MENTIIFFTTIIILMIISYFWCIKFLHLKNKKITFYDFLFYLNISTFFYWLIIIIILVKLKNKIIKKWNQK